VNLMEYLQVDRAVKTKQLYLTYDVVYRNGAINEAARLEGSDAWVDEALVRQFMRVERDGSLAICNQGIKLLLNYTGTSNLEDAVAKYLRLVGTQLPIQIRGLICSKWYASGIQLDALDDERIQFVINGVCDDLHVPTHLHEVTRQQYNYLRNFNEAWWNSIKDILPAYFTDPIGQKDLLWYLAADMEPEKEKGLWI